jgi:hypothetical protein
LTRHLGPPLDGMAIPLFEQGCAAFGVAALDCFVSALLAMTT